MHALALIVVLVVLPVVTELVKAAAARWGWFDASKLGPPIAGAVALAVYVSAWAVVSRDLSDLPQYVEQSLAVAFGAVSIHSLGAKYAPKAEQRIREVTGAVKLGGRER